MLGLPAERVTVAPPGVEPRFRPGGSRSPVPLVVAVGRLVPVKRFDLLIEALVRARREVAQPRGRHRRRGLRAATPRGPAPPPPGRGVAVAPGRASDDEVSTGTAAGLGGGLDLPREGWGMTLTEAGACATPAVATDIAGHRDAVLDGRTGLLVDGAEAVASAIVEVVSDEALRTRLGRGAPSGPGGHLQATARSTSRPSPRRSAAGSPWSAPQRVDDTARQRPGARRHGGSATRRLDCSAPRLLSAPAPPAGGHPRARPRPPRRPRGRPPP